MDAYALNCLANKKVTKTSKPKKKNPLKVVYISNPMNFKTSASEFRALVQELTGQDAEWPPDLTRLSHLTVGDCVGDGKERVSGAIEDEDEDQDHDDGSTQTVEEMSRLEEVGQHKQRLAGSSSELFDQLDEFFKPQIMDNYLEILPATVFY